jgi:hypothetical protein
MKEIVAQFDGYVYKPYALIDEQESKAFKVNQLVKMKISGAEKERSYPQLKRYWAIMGLIAQAKSDQNNIISAEDVDFEIKSSIAQKYPAMVRRWKVINGQLVIDPISIKYSNMKHLEACDYFDKADKEIIRLGYSKYIEGK